MSENENIEAKLCSYVEGDLDAAGRAEIERYLVAHPQYRPLIEQLSRTRGLLRGLPREAAPVELLETLSGQIERSALLGDEDPGGMEIRSSRFPHLAAWAAVLLLTGGLAAVIYRVLPSNKQQPELALLKPAPIAIAAPSATQGATDELSKPLTDVDKMLGPPSPEAPASPLPQIASGVPPVAAPLAATAPDTAQLALVPPPTTQPLADATATTVPTIASAGAVAAATVVADGTAVTHSSVMQQPTANPTPSGDATQLGQNLYVTLHATDAKAADARVVQYLNANGIPFESRSMDGQSMSAGPLPPVAPSASNSIDSASAVTASPPASNFRYATTTAFAAAIPMERFAKKAVSATSPAEAKLADAAVSAQSGQIDSGDVIIARNLSSDQARRLASDLNVTVLPAQLKLLPSTQAMAMDAGPFMSIGVSAAALQPGESVHLVAREKLLPDVDAMNETQTIDADGNLTLPMIGKLQAAGLTVSELAQKIPQAYRDAKSPTDAVWTIDRVPATRPAGGVALAPPPASPARPSTLPTGSAPPVMGAVAAVTGSGGAVAASGIDVTIRVVSQPAPTTAIVAEPTTAPAAAPAAAVPATLPTTVPMP